MFPFPFTQWIVLHPILISPHSIGSAFPSTCQSWAQLVIPKGRPNLVSKSPVYTRSFSLPCKRRQTLRRWLSIRAKSPLQAAPHPLFHQINSRSLLEGLPFFLSLPFSRRRKIRVVWRPVLSKSFPRSAPPPLPLFTDRLYRSPNPSPPLKDFHRYYYERLKSISQDIHSCWSP